MSLHMVYTIIQLLPLRTPSWSHSAEVLADDDWSLWLHLLTSRKIYSVIISLIVICCIMNAIKAKLGSSRNERAVKVEPTDWIRSFWKQFAGSYVNAGCGSFGGNCSSSGMKFNAFNLEDELNMSNISVMEKLATAEEELEAVKNALNDAKKFGSDLCENVREAEMEKDELKNNSLAEKERTFSEIQAAKADLTNLREHLDSLRKIKDDVMQKCNNLHMEAIKAEEALKLRQNMQQKLDESLHVIKMLKGALSSLKNTQGNEMNAPRSWNDESNFENNMSDSVFDNDNNPTQYIAVDKLHLLGQGDDHRQIDQSLMEEWAIDPNDECDQNDYSGVIFTGWALSNTNDVDHQLNDNEQQINAECFTDNDAIEDDNDTDNNTWKTDENDDQDSIELNSDFQLTNSLAFKQFLLTNFKQL